MSVYKTSSTLKFDEQDSEIVEKAKKTAKSMNKLKIELVKPVDTVAEDVEEMVILLEYRKSKTNQKLEKIKTLKKRFSKVF